MKNLFSSLSRHSERGIESVIFSSRWLLAPFYLGLIVGLVALLVRFWFEVVHLVTASLPSSESQTILGVLNLIDLSLVANLLLIVMFAGYESFVSRIDADEAERPGWMGKIGFSGLKTKLMASLAAISGIYLLEALLNMHSQTTTVLAWKVGIHVTFVVSGVLFAMMDRITASAEHGESGH